MYNIHVHHIHVHVCTESDGYLTPSEQFYTYKVYYGKNKLYFDEMNRCPTCLAEFVIVLAH
jgi:hypothetical protein